SVAGPLEDRDVVSLELARGHLDGLLEQGVEVHPGQGVLAELGKRGLLARAVSHRPATRLRRWGRPEGATSGAARPSCEAGTPATRSRRAPLRSRAGSGSRSSRGPRRASPAPAAARSRPP